MNAVKLLTKDHEKVKGLFRKFEQAGERLRQKTTLAEQTSKRKSSIRP